MKTQPTNRVSGIRCAVVGVLSVAVGLSAMIAFAWGMTANGLMSPEAATWVGAVVGGLNGLNVVNWLSKWATGYDADELSDLDD